MNDDVFSLPNETIPERKRISPFRAEGSSLKTIVILALIVGVLGIPTCCRIYKDFQQWKVNTFPAAQQR